MHAGDIGDPLIIAELEALAPVTAIRGNIDKGAWAESLPETEVVQIGESAFLYMLHRMEALDLDPAAAGFYAVIYGQTHKPEYKWKAGVLYVNPGSAGPRRLSRPISVECVIVEGITLSVKLIEIDERLRWLARAVRGSTNGFARYLCKELHVPRPA